MNSLLVAALVLPILGIVGVVVTAGPASRHDVQARWVTGLAAAAAAGAWAIIAGAGEAPEVGGIIATTDVAVAAAGVSLLVAASRPSTTLGRATSLAAATAFAAGAGSGAADPGLPDRPFAAGVLALVVLSVIADFADRPAGAARGPAVVMLVAGVVSAVALSLDDLADGPGPVMVLAALALAVIVSIRTSPSDHPSGVLALPGLLLAADAVVAAAPRTDDLDRVGLAAAAVAAVAVAAVARVGAGSPERPGDGVRILPLAVVGSGVAVAFQSFPDARGAGLLLTAGGVVALATRHPWGLVAAVPGLTAAFAAFGAASEPEHGAAAVAAAALLLVAAHGSPPARHGPTTPTDRTLVGAAVGFAAVPLWGWTGLALPEHAEGLAVAAAFALPVVIALRALEARRDAALPGVRVGSTGRLPSRRNPAAAPSHGSTILDFQGEVPVQDDVPQAGFQALEVQEEAGHHEAVHDEEDPEDAHHGRPPQLAVAVPPEPVPVRARRDRAPLRGRVRPRPGRTP